MRKLLLALAPLLLIADIAYAQNLAQAPYTYGVGPATSSTPATDTVPQTTGGSTLASGWIPAINLAASGAGGVTGTLPLTGLGVTLSGNTTKLVTQGAGATTSGHQLVYDANGNSIDGGVPGGGGTVTNIATSAPISGGAITNTGTISLTGPSNLTTFTAGTIPMGATTSPFAASEITDVASGGVTIGSPTGGQKGAGTINMTGCFINNVACAAGSSTSFSAITGSTNTSAAMVLGSGASLATSGTGTNAATSAPLAGISGLGTGVGTALGVNVGTAGSVLVNGGALGTPSSGTLTSATGLPISTGLTGAGTNVLTALGVNVGSAGAFVVNGGAGGTPSSLTLTSATGLPYTALPALSANTVLGALTATTPSGLALPSCTDAGGNHLNWTSGTGFSCGTSGSGGGVASLNTSSSNLVIGGTGSGPWTGTVTVNSTLPTRSQAGGPIVAADGGGLVYNTGGTGITLPVHTTSGLGAGFGTEVLTDTSAATITVTTDTINGNSTEPLGIKQGIEIIGDGTSTYKGILGMPEPVASGVMVSSSGRVPFWQAGTSSQYVRGNGTADQVAAFTSGTLADITGLGIRDTSAAFDLTLAATSSTTLTAGRTLTFDVVNAGRTVKLGSNLTIASDPGAVTGVIKSNGSGTFAAAACADLSNGATGCSTATGTSGATIPLLNGTNTWSGVQTINNGDLSLAGSGSGNTLLEASSAAGSGTVATFPANTGIVAELNLAQSWTAPQRTNTNTPTISTTTFTPVFSAGQNIRIAFPATTCSCTIANPAAIVAGQSGMFELVQGATSASLDPTWGSEYLYAGGTSTITLSTGLGAIDYIPYYVDSTGSFIVLGGIIKGPAH